MNTYQCIDCGKISSPTCECGSARLQIIGDLHIIAKHVDAYINICKIDGRYHLLIKKPSGQVSIPLQNQDLLTSFPR